MPQWREATVIFRTEFSFRQAFGTIEQCLARLPLGGIIADDGTWGHAPLRKAAKGIPTGLGWRVRVGEGDNWREIIIVPTSATGLRDMYALVRLANEQFYWFPRLAPSQIGPGDWTLIASGRRSGSPPSLPTGCLIPTVPGLVSGGAVAFSNNFYPSVGDREAWDFALGSLARANAEPSHIMTNAELLSAGVAPETIAATLELLSRSAAVPLPKAENIKWRSADSNAELRAICDAEFTRRRLEERDGYAERLARELALVADKKFADYFLVIADLIKWAKQRMLVGPGRGSSAGSIVCWLLGIVEVDPIRHGLLFERFIDVNRFDIPDIDIDFPDTGRQAVLQYLAERYGQENVAHIGTVMRYKPKSALADVARELKIPKWETDAFTDTILERSSGDSRVNDCLADTFKDSERGQELLAKYPLLEIACRLEGGARQSGKHAAGMIVCNEAVSHFCGMGRDRVAQLDKKSAEALNMLKIDALGLRTLSVLDTACNISGVSRDFLYTMPLNDAKALEVLNEARFSNVFQFEGNAMQSLSRQIVFREFNDLVAITALARPGPLGGGEATSWVLRHEAKEAIVYAHPKLEEVTRETLGNIMYQEQVMTMCRSVGNFSWADTAAIRKLMSDRKGDEQFRKFSEQFIAGAVANGMILADAEKLWKAINNFGRWAMNKSHCVVYGLVSYWCCWFKAHHPLAFAAGCLRHAKDTDGALATLRELVREGIDYTPFDETLSGVDWEVKDGRLLGGLTGVPGIGQKTAADIVNRRVNNMKMKPGQIKLMQRKSVFADPFPCRTKWAHLYAAPHKYQIFTRLVETSDIKGPGEYCIIGKVLKKNLRDHNEDRYLLKRNGVRMDPSKFLIVHVGDDTGQLIGIVSRWNFEDIGKKIVAEAVEDTTWLLMKGTVNDMRFFDIQKVRWLKELPSSAAD